MSIGIGGKVFGKGFELFIGKRGYAHSLALIKVSSLDLDEKINFSVISLELAIRW